MSVPAPWSKTREKTSRATARDALSAEGGRSSAKRAKEERPIGAREHGLGPRERQPIG